MKTRHKGNETEARALGTFVKFMRAADAMTHRVTREIKRVGLTVSQFGVLELLYHLGPRHQNEIAKKLLKNPFFHRSLRALIEAENGRLCICET